MYRTAWSQWQWQQGRKFRIAVESRWENHHSQLCTCLEMDFSWLAYEFKFECELKMSNTFDLSSYCVCMAFPKLMGTVSCPKPPPQEPCLQTTSMRKMHCKMPVWDVFSSQMLLVLKSKHLFYSFNKRTVFKSWKCHCWLCVCRERGDFSRQQWNAW